MQKVRKGKIKTNINDLNAQNCLSISSYDEKCVLLRQCLPHFAY